MELTIERAILIVNKCRTCLCDKIDEELTIFEFKEINSGVIQISEMLSAVTSLDVSKSTNSSTGLFSLCIIYSYLFPVYN